MEISDIDEAPHPSTMTGSTASLIGMTLNLLWHWTWRLSARGFLYGAFYGVWFFIIGAIYGCVFGLIAGAVSGLLNGVVLAILYVMIGRSQNGPRVFLQTATYVAPVLTGGVSYFVLRWIFASGLSGLLLLQSTSGFEQNYFFTVIPALLAGVACWQAARKMADWRFE